MDHHKHLIEVDRRKFQAEHNQSRVLNNLEEEKREDDAIRRLVLQAARRRRLLTKWDDLPLTKLRDSQDMLRDGPRATIIEDLFANDDDVDTPLLAVLEFARAATLAEERGAHSHLLSSPFIRALAHIVPDEVLKDVEERARNAHKALAEAAAVPKNRRPWTIDLEETANENKQAYDGKAQLPTDSRGFDERSSRQVALTLAALMLRGPTAVEKNRKGGPRLIGEKKIP